MTSHLKLAFAGTPELAATILRKLIETDLYTITNIFTRPDRPAGRGRKLQKSPVKEFCESVQVPLKQPLTSAELERDKGLADTDILIVAAYGTILSPTVLNIPRLGCINVHTSILPRWRGAAPIQRAIQAGDGETGITIMQMDAGLDTGDILLQKACAIDPRETAGSLHDKLADLGAEVLLDALNHFNKGTVERRTQNNDVASYAHKISKAEAKIDWTLPAQTIERTVRAFNPFPIAHTVLNDVEMRVWDVELMNGGDKEQMPGTIIDCSSKGIDIQTGDQVIRIHQIQLPGKKVVTVSAFLNGHPDFSSNS